jgi:predicted phage terminase large subunit-like protein
MRGLRSDIRPEKQGRIGRVLFEGVREPRPCGKDDRDSQPGMAGRHESATDAAALSKGIQAGAAEDYRTRWRMRGLQDGGIAGSAPYRYEPIEQSVGEFGHALRNTSHRTTCGREVETEADIVAGVERVCEPTEVYDIQVEGTECFFANGILVHNCAIIDDPLKDRESADSETVREKQWKWYNSTLRSRLRPGASIILVMTRWHGDDLGGRLLAAQRDMWDFVKLPAIAEEDDALGREPGEYLWGDDTYDYANELRAVHAEYELNGAMRDWGALYQQDPKPAEGALFKTDKIEILPVAPAGRNEVRAWDLAATAESGTAKGAYTAGVRMLRTDSGRFVVTDVKRFKGGPDEVIEKIVNTATQDGRHVRVGIPQDPGQSGKSQVLWLTRALAGFRVESSPESGKKEERAGPVAAQCNVGNLSLVDKGEGTLSQSGRAFIDELASFPSGTYKDQVDALSRAFEMVGLGPRPMNITDAMLHGL